MKKVSNLLVIFSVVAALFYGALQNLLIWHAYHGLEADDAIFYQILLSNAFVFVMFAGNAIIRKKVKSSP